MAPQEQRSRRDGLINGAACLLACAYLASVIPTLRSDADFRVYYEAAAALRAGGDPYLVPAYVYGPIFAWLLQPATALPLQQAHQVWLLTQLASLLGLVWLSIRHSGAAVAQRYWGVVTLCAVVAVPTYIDLLLGQTGGIMALLTVAGYSAARRGARLAGWFLGLATALKVYPAFLALAYLRRRQWREAAALAVGAALLTGATALLCGPGLLLGFAAKLVQGSGYPYTAEHNISLVGFWLRIFTANPFVRPLVELPWAAQAAIALSSAGLLCVCLWRGQQDDPDADRLQFSMWLCAMLLLFPATGMYNLLLLLFPLLVCVRVYETYGFAFVRWGLLLTGALLYVPPLSSVIPIERIQAGYGVALYFTPATYAVVALFIVLALALARLRRAQMGQDSTRRPSGVRW